MKRLLLPIALLAVACGEPTTKDTVHVLDPEPSPVAAPNAEPGEPHEEPAPVPAEPPSVGSTPPAPQVEPLQLEIYSPRRGDRGFGGAVTVAGRISGGEAPVVEVAGQRVELAPDGSFTADIAVQPGINFVHTEVSDGPRSAADSRAVLAEADADPQAVVEQALRLNVGPEGLDQIAGLVSDYVNTLDFEALARTQLPAEVELESLSHGDVEVELTPRRDAMEVTLRVEGMRAALAGTVSRFGLSVTFRGSASANPRVRGRLTLDAEDGEPVLEIYGVEADLFGFDYDIRNVPDFVEGWFEGVVREFIEDTLVESLEDFVVPALFDPESLNREVEILGAPLSLGLGIAEIAVDADGLDVVLDAHASARQVVHSGRAFSQGGGQPFRGAGPMDLAVAADLMSRVMHSAWAGGLLDYSLDPAAVELPIRLTPALLAPALGALAAEIDLSAPLSIGLRPLLPPVVRIEEGEHPVVVEVGDLMLDLSLPDGLLASVAVQVVARARLDVEASEGISLKPEFEVEVIADLADSPRGDIDAAKLETLIETLASAIPSFIAGQTFNIGADVLPLPIRLEAPRLRADGAAPFMHIQAGLAPR